MFGNSKKISDLSLEVWVQQSAINSLRDYLGRREKEELDSVTEQCRDLCFMHKAQFVRLEKNTSSSPVWQGSVTISYVSRKNPTMPTEIKVYAVNLSALPMTLLRTLTSLQQDMVKTKRST